MRSLRRLQTLFQTCRFFTHSTCGLRPNTTGVQNILIHGPEGIGKSCVARIAAKEYGCKMLDVNLGEAVSSKVGYTRGVPGCPTASERGSEPSLQLPLLVISLQAGYCDQVTSDLLGNQGTRIALPRMLPADKSSIAFWKSSSLYFVVCRTTLP